jgi:large subunit ribosomal protein L29
MKAADLRDKSVEELTELRKSIAHDTFQNRLKNFTNRLDDTSSIRKTKRDLARVLTTLRQRELATAPEAALSAPAAPAKADTKTSTAKAAPAPEGSAEAPQPPSPKKAAAKKREAKSQ